MDLVFFWSSRVTSCLPPSPHFLDQPPFPKIPPFNFLTSKIFRKENGNFSRNVFYLCFADQKFWTSFILHSSNFFLNIYEQLKFCSRSMCISQLIMNYHIFKYYLPQTRGHKSATILAMGDHFFKKNTM